MYNIYNMELSNNEKIKQAQLKAINGEQLSIMDKIALGRDIVYREIDGYQLKPDCVYRTISKELLKIYKEKGYIIGISPDDEYMEYEEDGKKYNNNKGVDWYLGGVAPKYGDIVIECPAYEEYFTPAMDNGSGMALDPYVRFMKSSGVKNPIPISLITNIFYINKELQNSEINSKTESHSKL